MTSAGRHSPLSRILAGTLALLFFVIFVALGSWQLERRVWKLDLIARVEQRVHAPPVTAPGPSQWPAVTAASDEYRHITATGTFLDHSQTLVQAVTDLGAGYWVLTPLREADGSIVLVNRGFVPADARDRVQRAVTSNGGDAARSAPTTVTSNGGDAVPSAPTTVTSNGADAVPSAPTTVTSNGADAAPGASTAIASNGAEAAADTSMAVTVTGLLRITEPRGAFLRHNDPAANRWYSRDVQAIAASHGLTHVAPYFIDADASSSGPPGQPGAAPVGGLTVITFHNSHLVYAITWYTLALMVAGATWIGIRNETRA